MSYINIIRGQSILRKSLLLVFIPFFIIIISSSSVFSAEIFLMLNNGLGNSSQYDTVNGTYTPNNYVSLVTSFNGGYSSSQAVADYGSIGVSTTILNNNTTSVNNVAYGMIGDSYTLTGGISGSTVGMSLLVGVSGFIDLINYDSGTVYGDLYITIHRYDENWNSLDLYQWSTSSEGFTSTSFLSPEWSYEIGKNYNFQLLAVTGSRAENGYVEASFIDTVSFSGVRIYTDQTSGIGVTTGSGRELALTFSPENPPGQSVSEPSTLLLLGSGLVGLIGYGRRRFMK